MITTSPPQAAPIAQPPSPAPPRRPSHTTSPLRALLLKEFYENILVILLCWIIDALILIPILYVFTESFTRSLIHASYLMDITVISLISVLCAMSGFIIGFIQYRSQRSFDQWVFLIHHPISRSRIFLYKSLAGILFYSLTAGLPLIIFILWVCSNPQATPIFHWRFLLPHAAGFISGIPCYFAGALIAQRQAHWLATRFLPFLSALVVFVASMTLSLFSAVLAVELLAIIFFALAAWGGMLSYGRFTGVPLAARAGLLVTLIIASLAPLALVSGFARNSHDRLLNELYYQFSESSPRRSFPYTRTYPVIVALTDGRIVEEMHTYTYGQGYDVITESKQYTTLTGEPIPDAHPITTERWTGISLQSYRPPSPNFRNVDSILSNDLFSTNTEWHYFPHEHHLLAFNPVTHKLDGSLGPSGFRSADQPPEPFNFSLGLNAFYSPAAYYRIDFDMHTLQKIAIPADELLRSVRIIDKSNNAPKMAPLLGLVTDKHIYLYNNDSLTLEAVLPLNHQQDKLDVSLAFSSDFEKIVLRYRSNPYLMQPIYFEVYDKSGVPFASAVIDPKSTVLGLYYKQFSPPIIMHLGSLASFTNGLIVGWGVPLPSNDELGTLASFIPDSQALAGIIIIRVLALSGLLFLLRHYRLALVPALAWLLLVLLLGPFLLLAFLGFHTRPTLNPCPACHKKRPVHEPLCPHCRAPFPPPTPTPTGTEIFT